MPLHRPQLLPKTHPEYIHWYNSLASRPAPWNKGKTKETDESVRKISFSLRDNKIDNFKEWRDKAFAEHRKLVNLPLEESYDLAVLTGLVLGDGHICRFPRTESLTIVLNLKYPELIEYATALVEKVFNKKPTVRKPKDSNGIRVQFYQQNISGRLFIKSGSRKDDVCGMPTWIFSRREYIIGCLRGLFEAEGSLSVHLPTCTYNFQFRNHNEVLLRQVKESLADLGYHPEVRDTSIRLRRRAEVRQFEELISFRQYNICEVI